MTKNNILKKIRNCSLPIFCDDDDGKWLFNNGEDIKECSELYEAFSQIIKADLDFHFEINLKYYDAQKNCLKSEAQLICCHNFNDVIEAVYFYPESFIIPDKYKDDYSKQAIAFLNKLQNYLMIINVKDTVDSKEKINFERKYIKAKRGKKYFKELAKMEAKATITRACNKKCIKYRDVEYLKADDNIIAAILKEDKKTRIFRQYSNSSSRVGKKYFVLDNDNNYKLLIEIIKEDIIPFKEFKPSVKDYKLSKCKSAKEYKEQLYNYFIQDDISQENFNEDSLISIATFKINEKY